MLKIYEKRTLQFSQNDYHSSYETLLHKSRKTTGNVQSLRNLCKEIFKSLSNLNPVFLKNVFISKNRTILSEKSISKIFKSLKLIK